MAYTSCDDTHCTLCTLELSKIAPTLCSPCVHYEHLCDDHHELNCVVCRLNLVKLPVLPRSACARNGGVGFSPAMELGTRVSFPCAANCLTLCPRLFYSKMPDTSKPGQKKKKSASKKRPPAKTNGLKSALKDSGSTRLTPRNGDETLSARKSGSGAFQQNFASSFAGVNHEVATGGAREPSKTTTKASRKGKNSDLQGWLKEVDNTSLKSFSSKKGRQRMTPRKDSTTAPKVSDPRVLKSRSSSKMGGNPTSGRARSCSPGVFQARQGRRYEIPERPTQSSKVGNRSSSVSSKSSNAMPKNSKSTARTSRSLSLGQTTRSSSVASSRNGESKGKRFGGKSHSSRKINGYEQRKDASNKKDLSITKKRGSQVDEMPRSGSFKGLKKKTSHIASKANQYTNNGVPTPQIAGSVLSPGLPWSPKNPSYPITATNASTAASPPTKNTIVTPIKYSNDMQPHLGSPSCIPGGGGYSEDMHLNDMGVTYHDDSIGRYPSKHLASHPTKDAPQCEVPMPVSTQSQPPLREDVMPYIDLFEYGDMRDDP